MQLPNLQANQAASSTVAPKKQTSIRPQSGGLMKATMTNQLMPDDGSKIKSSAPKPTSAQSFMRTTMASTPQTQNSAVQPSRYTPDKLNVNSDMRVEDRAVGLMSADNPLMKKAREQANQYSASRGLQSSSIANENALNAMFNVALPIAQQDADTYTTVATVNNQNAQQVGMQDNASLNQLYLNKDNQQFQSGQSAQDRALQKELQESQQQFQSGENQADREFKAGESQADREFTQELESLRYENSLGLLDAEGEQRMKELETQFANQQDLIGMEQDFQSGENQANRDFQMEMEKFKTASQLEVNMALQDDMQSFNKELEEIRNANQLGLLDAEGELRMQELEQQNVYAMQQMDKSAQIQAQRDSLLQSFQQANMKLEAANRLTELEAQTKANMKIQGAQNAFAQKIEYSNAVSNAVNQGIASLGEAFMNPEIDPSQYSNIQDQIQNMVQQNIDTYDDIYGIGGELPPQDPYSENRGNDAANGVDNRVPGGTTGGGTTGGGSPPSPGRTRQQSVGGGLMGNAAYDRFNTDLPAMATR